MTSINPINVNTQGIGSSFGYGAKAKSEDSESTDEAVVSSGSQQNQVAADDVLSFMAQSAVSVTPASISSIDTSKYVDSESANRIAGFVSQFEDKVAEGLTAFNQEFAGVDVSDSAKMAVVLAGIDNQS
jgi:hypothetical protein